MNRLWKFIEKKDMPYIIAVAVLGTLNHFLYELSGGAAIFALFCPVNESTWEHLKLLFFPYLFASIWQYINSKPDLGLSVSFITGSLPYCAAWLLLLRFSILIPESSGAIF